MRFWDIRVFGQYPIINSVVFGQYGKLVRALLGQFAPDGRKIAGSTLQISSAFGHVVPDLAEKCDDYHLVDIIPAQLQFAKEKLDERGIRATLSRMNAEHLRYLESSFNNAVIFMLLHELTPETRERILREAIRIVKPHGKLYIAEYNEFAGEGHWCHPLHRWVWFRWTSGILEPYLPAFWRENLENKLREAAAAVGKQIHRTKKTEVFAGFYRVHEYAIS